MLKWLKTHSLRRKLVLLFLLIGLTPLAITAFVTSHIAQSHLSQQTFAHLDSIRQLKGSAIQRYFNQTQNQIISLAESSMLRTAMKSFDEAFQQVNISDTSPNAKNVSATLRQYYRTEYGKRYVESAGFEPSTEELLSTLSLNGAALQEAYIADSPYETGKKNQLARAEGLAKYHETHAKYHPDLESFIERFGYYDLFLIDARSGHVVYSTFKEIDFATSLISGPFSHSGLGKAYQEASLLAKGEFSLQDYAPYTPSYETPASFIATPIFDELGRTGVLVFQMPLEPINTIMNERAGMGTTGESYLLGQDNLIRSDSFLSPEKYSVTNSFLNPGSQQINTTASQQSLAGMTGNALSTDYLGNEVLSSYSALNLGSFQWSLVVKINAEEALQSTHLISRAVLALVVISTLIIIALALMLTRQLTRPLKELSQASKAAAKGQRDVMISPSKDIEVNELTKAFNHMLETRQQYEQRLEHALAEAHQATLIKSEFLASMSHEIRTPMNGVLGMLGLVQNSPLNSTQRHRIEVAEGSAKSLLNLINDILDFSKVDAGKLGLENLDFNPRQLFGDISEAMACQAQNKGLELIVDMQHIDVSMVKGDPARIRQVVTNLVSNAIKFTDAGEVVIRAALTSKDDHHWTLRCDVSDTGIGIPKSKITHLFDAFSQVDTSTTRQYGGTGLGLAIVKRLCELMDGDISVASQENKGSCFSVSVQLSKSQQSQPVLPTVDLSSLKILIVDDNLTNREVLRAQLSYWGAQVSEASSGEKALLFCQQRARENAYFDIAILDMQMPQMDGAELGQRLKSDPILSTIKLVMMTSVGHSGDSHYFKELGFDAYFPKPVTTSDLFNALSLISAKPSDPAATNPIVTSNYIQTLKPANKSIMRPKPLSLHKHRILLVEDNQVNQLVASGLLEQLGIRPDVAANGFEALSALSIAPEDEPYDLVLMDCQMPEMDGYEATKQIRAGKSGERNRDICIIALTANAMRGDREKCITAGMNDYLSKPLDGSSLEVKITVWLAPD